MPWISGGNEPRPRMPIGAVMIPMEINAYPREVITNGVNKNGIKASHSTLPAFQRQLVHLHQKDRLEIRFLKMICSAYSWKIKHVSH